MGLKCKANKKSYPNKLEADKALKDISLSSDTRAKSPVRSYKCVCGKYHLTSMEEKTIQKYVSDTNKRTAEREKKFINRETEYYIKKFRLGP
jgi:hypothetical protein